MFQPLKKILSVLAITSLTFQHLTFLAYAAGDLVISPSSALFNGTNVTSFSVNPGSTFSVNFGSSNNLAEPIQQVYLNMNFSNNAGFAYQGVDEKTRIASVTVNNPVPSSAWNSSTGLHAEITSAGTPQVGAGQSFDMIRASASSFSAFLVANDISTYSNSITIGFEAQKVSDSSPVTGDTINRTIYANVKPHIVDYYFEKADGSTTTNQIQGDQAEAVSLVMKVKDYNGCGNIDGGLVTADLSVIGLSTSENLVYNSCLGDGKTAVFKKTGVTTLAALGDKIFSYGGFYARDENNNVMDPNDGNTTFDDEDKKADLVLTVIPAAAPNVSIISTSEAVIGGPSKTTSLVTFSGSQNGEFKVALGSDGSCTGGTTLRDWTGSGSYSANTATGVIVSVSSLAEGSNSIYACFRNSGGNIGSASTAITKDTVAPTFAIPVTMTSNVILNDPSVSVRCSENGVYQVEVGGNGTFGNGTVASNGAAAVGVTNTVAIANALLSLGANPINVFCQDAASNTVAYSGSINKNPPTPTMASQTTAFADNDLDYDGLDGRDLTLSWSNANAVGFNTFESYRIYVLPSATAFSGGTQTYVKLLTDKNLSTWTGDTTLTHDSLGASLVSGASYKACIAIMGTSGQLGTEGCTAAATLTADTVTHPTILSARFTSDTNLEITTDATLDTTLSNHSGALVSFVRGGTVTATGVGSVSGTKINFTIPSLGSISATGSTLIVGTGAIRANGGGFNNAFSSGSLTITDAQAPTITGFSKTTAAGYGTFYSGSVNFDYTFAETMLGAGSTRFELTRTSGNSDSVTHIVNLTAGNELSSGSHTKAIDFSTLSLVSGTTYRVQLIGKDLANNSVNSAYIMNVSYDNVGPGIPTLTDAVSFSTLTPTLSWTAPSDDNGNGSGIGKYVLKLYNNTACVPGNLVQTYDPVTAPASSKTLTTLATNPGTYSWNLSAVDNMGNSGTGSSCDDFIVDTALPMITGQSITDTTISNTSYTKNADSLSITANVSSTDSAHIWLDMSSLAGSGAYSNVQCSAPLSGVSCNYAGGIVTYTFNTAFAGSVNNGVRQVQFHSQNTSGINDQTAIASITVDNTAPSVSASAITSPNWGEVWGGTGRTITWNSAAVTDAVGISNVRLEFSTGANVWNLISNGPNSGSYVWDITNLESRNDYTIRLTAFDPVGNSTSDTSNAVFTIDRAAPTVPNNTLTTPNGGIYQGGTVLPITWNNASITDGGGLAANPISLEYSLNGGTNWVSIATGIANDGTRNWTVPTTNTAAALVRLTATDTANNASSDESDSNFIIDSANPVQTISYAGGGGNTPQNGRKINNSGLDLTLSATDAYLDQVYYQLVNTSDGLYWNNSSNGWLGVDTWNSLCTDGTSLGTNLACSNISTTITPTILDGKNYTIVFRSVDEAGNSVTSITHTYVGDTTPPSLAIATASGSYLTNGINISGTASDAGSGLSSVKIQIQKGSQYWDGSSWVGTATSLLTQTSNGYANWTYAFNPPLADSDGQSYTVTATAYDSAYKTNNSTSASIGITKDSSGPTIASDVFTFNTSTLYRGGNNLTITWDPAKVTTSGAGLASNPITLSYNFTGSVVTIASNIANSGSYVLSLPSVDTTTAKIIIEAADTVGNTSTPVASQNFTIDSLPPTVSSVTTMDNDANGQIDAIRVVMSEAIQDSSITLANFSIGSGIGTPTGFLTGLSSNDDTFILTFNNTGTTASVPTLSYTAGTLVDQADNHLANVSNFASTDGVPPRVVDVKMFDNNGNGKMDAIKVRFGEDLQANAASLFAINNALAGMSIASVSRNAASHDTFDLVLNESTAADTSVGSMTLDFTNNGTYKDTANNAAINFSSQTIIDQAKPVIVSSTTNDTNANSKVDRIDIQFSEAISGNVDGEFSLGSLATGSTKGASSIAGNVLRLAVNETSDDNDTALAPTFSYSGTSLVDSAGNTVTAISNAPVSDGVAPKLLSRVTRDLDANGKIDAIKFTFSENLGANLSAISTSVAGYTVSGYDSTCDGSTAGDGIVCAILAEKTVADTDATPAVQITANTTLADAAGNIALAESGATNATDAAGPVIIGARYDSMGAGVADDTITLTFSENLNAASVANLSSTDFVLNGGGAFGGSSTTAFTSGNSATITMGAGATALTAGTSKISIVTGAIEDSLSNPSGTEGVNNRVTVTSSVIINEVMWSGTGSAANQYVELKNIGTSPVSINGWVLANAGGNGVDITLPNDMISGGGLYLIAKSSESASLLNVTPNFVTNSMNLAASQNDLVLKSGAVVYDTAKANPWPAGDANAPASMERRSPAGDGTVGTNWYVAQTGVGFDAGASAARGTPGSQNIFDAISPTISSFSPSSNVLLPSTPKQISFAYSDSGGSIIDVTSASLLLQKWNGASYADVTATYVNTGSTVVTASGATYPLAMTPFGKYRATFVVADTAGNTTQQIIDFYVDQTSFTLSGNALDVGQLSVGNLDIGSTEVIVTVKTLGAAFTLAHNRISSPTASGGLEQIQDYDGNTGFGFDYSESGSGNTVTYAGTINSVNGSTLANYPLAIDPNGNQKTYVYRIKYGAKIAALQAAGIYSGKNAFDVDWNY